MTQNIRVGDWIVVTSEVELKMSPYLRGNVYRVDQIVGPPRFAHQVGFSALGLYGVPVRQWVKVKRVVKIDPEPIIYDYKSKGGRP